MPINLGEINSGGSTTTTRKECAQLYAFNGVGVAPPTTFDLKLNDIDGDSKRNEHGEMVRIVIASDKRTYSCAWNNISISEKNAILQNTSSKYGNATFDVYFCNEYDEDEHATFYRGTNVSITPVLVLSDTEKYYNLSFDIIEV